LSWKTEIIYRFDFEIRAKFLDLILYLCVRSFSMIEQHSAVVSRILNNQKFDGFYYFEQQKQCEKKTTTTVLLKPFLSMEDLKEIDKNELFMVLIFKNNFFEIFEIANKWGVCK
jgi:hypothetical protein